MKKKTAQSFDTFLRINCGKYLRSIAQDVHAVSPVALDEEYKSAIQPVVDNNMRTDILGPHFCRVLENHTPASTAIVCLVAKAACSEPDFKESIKQVVEEYHKENKMKWVNMFLGAIGTIIIAVIVWGIETLIKK